MLSARCAHRPQNPQAAAGLDHKIRRPHERTRRPDTSDLAETINVKEARGDSGRRAPATGPPDAASSQSLIRSTVMSSRRTCLPSAPPNTEGETRRWPTGRLVQVCSLPASARAVQQRRQPRSLPGRGPRQHWSGWQSPNGTSVEGHAQGGQAAGQVVWRARSVPAPETEALRPPQPDSAHLAPEACGILALCG